MLESFYAFNQNAISSFLYIFESNVWLMLLVVGMLGTVVLQLKEEIDISVRDEQRII